MIADFHCLERKNERVHFLSTNIRSGRQWEFIPDYLSAWIGNSLLILCAKLILPFFFGAQIVEEGKDEIKISGK